MQIKFKRTGPNYVSACGVYDILHAGTRGRSTRLFKLYRDGESLGGVATFTACKRAAIADAANRSASM